MASPPSYEREQQPARHEAHTIHTALGDPPRREQDPDDDSRHHHAGDDAH